MSEKMIQNVRELATSISENSECVEQELSRKHHAPAPPKVDRAVVTSAAKYRKALTLLANE